MLMIGVDAECQFDDELPGEDLPRIQGDREGEGKELAAENSVVAAPRQIAGRTTS
jgi:hypothetical protein